MAFRDIDQGLRLDKDASKIAVGYWEGLEDRAIMEAIAPQMKVKPNGKYPSYGVGAWYDDDEDEIGPGTTKVPEYLPPAESWNEYVIGMHARKVKISNSEADSEGIAEGMVYSDPGVAAERLTDVLYQRFCKLVADTVLATGNSAAPGTAWDQSGAVPFDDIQTWKKSLKDAIGVGGPSVLTTDRVIEHLGEGIRTKYSHTGNMSNFEIVSKNMMRDLGIRNIHISEEAERYVSSASAYQSIWGNNFILFKNQKQMNGWRPTYMVTLVPKKKPFIQVLRAYGQEELDYLGYYIQVRMYYLYKELDSNAVYIGSSVIS